MFTRDLGLSIIPLVPIVLITNIEYDFSREPIASVQFRLMLLKVVGAVDAVLYSACRILCESIIHNSVVHSSRRVIVVFIQGITRRHI